MKKRILSLILTACMLAGMLPAEALAADGENGVHCVHVHDESCGYVEPVPEQPCGHVHDETCGHLEAVPGTPCSHVHDEACGYVEPVPETPCGHVHDEACGYVEPTPGTPCGHLHDETCGYTAPGAGTPCGHVHDGACGFAEAVPEAPCTLDCVDEDGDEVTDHAAGCGWAPAVPEQPCGHVHDEACGYAEPTPGTPCAHTHDEACGYTAPSEGTPCSHAHDEGCGWAPAVPGVPCGHVHDEACGYTAPVEGAPCGHVHDEACGWAPAVEGQPCGHVCTVESGCLDPEPEPVPEPVPEPDPAEPETDESLEIEVEEPGEALFDAGYSVVLTLPGAWDSYDWQVWLGEENGGWTSLGAEDPALPVIKEMFVSFAFRCVVEKDGVKTASAPYAYNEVALIAPLGAGVNLLAWGEADFQSHWKGSSYIAVAKGRKSNTCFDVYGRENGGDYKTTFMNGGYTIGSEVDGVNLCWSAGPGTAVSMGGSLTGRFDYDIVYGGRYVKITYKVTNNGSTEKEFKIGSSGDVMIDKNDYAEVRGTATGLQMDDGAGKKFNLVVPTATTKWFGFFSRAYNNMFTSMTAAELNTPYNGDSGMAWSWTGTVKPGQTWSRYALIGVGELPPSPDPPTIPNLNSTSLVAGGARTVTGTAAAGNTVYLSVDGQEYSALADSSGKFSVNVSLPADYVGGTADVTYWAVSPEGGISGTKNATLNVLHGPVLELSPTAATVMEGQTLDEAWYKSFLKAQGGTVTHTTISTATLGEKTVTYTAKMNGFSDVTARLTVTVLPEPAELTKAVAAPSGKSFTLTSTMVKTGGLTYTETGFVYGAFQNPSLGLCDGFVKTSGPVNTKGGTLSAAVTNNLTYGIRYYARAYAKAGDGTVFYGPQSEGFGLGADFGTFSVAYTSTSGSTTTFTISRTGGSDGVQKVYYRTVNGSAVGGLNFHHADGVLTFADGVTSKTVQVTELGNHAIYGSKVGTQYANADRIYQMEINRVEGGAVIGTRFAERNMGHSTDYEVDRGIYTTEKSQAKTTTENTKWVVDHTGGAAGDTYWKTDRDYNAGNNKNNFNSSASIAGRYDNNEEDYIKETAQSYLYRYVLRPHEEEDGWEHAWMGTDKPKNAGTETKCDGDYAGNAISLNDSAAGDAIWTAVFEVEQGSTVNKNFPTLQGGGGEDSGSYPDKVTKYNADSSSITTIDGETYAKIPIDSTVYNYYSAGGRGTNRWYVVKITDYTKIYDTKEPQLLDVAFMARNSSTTTYLPGDPITISLIFDEIVDKANSEAAGLNSSSYVTVDGWSNKFYYKGGADTNVLYFTGTTPDDPPSGDGNLKVTLNCAAQIKDMCDNTGGTQTSGTGSSTAPVGTTNKPTVSVGAITNTNGTLTAQITASNADRLEYVWSTESTAPAAGWKSLTNKSGETVTTRQGAGTWYLHARAISAGGMAATDSKSVNIPASGSGSLVVPNLTVSANNSAWAKTRPITVTKKPTDATVKVKTPSGTTTNVSGGSYTATANGTYTFTLTSGGETVSQTISVSKLDLNAPTVTIDALPKTSYVEPVTLTVRAADSESGLKTVTGTWTKSGSSNSKPAVLNQTSGGVYLTTSPNESGTWTLTVTATDKVGNTKSATSKAYTLDLKLPTVTVTKTGTNANGSVNYSYSVNRNGQTIQTVQLPDGTVTTAISGSFTLTSAGTYYVVVTDTAGHVVQSAAMTVTNSGSDPVDGEPPEIRLRESTTDWVKPSTGVTITTSVYDNIEPTGAAWSPKDGSRSGTNIVLKTDAAAGVGSKAKTGSFKVTANGTYTVTAQDARGNTAETEIEIANIDPTAPAIGDPSGNPTSWTASDAKISFSVTDDQSGVKTVTAKKGSASVTIANNSSSFSFTATENGDYVITATDSVGNTSTKTVKVEKIDKAIPGLTVSGGETGAASLELTVKAVNTGGSGIKTSTVSKDGGAAETITGGTYTVTGAGSYVFTATTGAGLTKSQTVNVYNVAFAETGESTVPGQIVASGGKAVQPTVSKAGYTLSGWKSGTSNWAFSTNTVTADTTLTAQWALDPPTVTVTATPENGTAAYTGGTVVTLTAEPSHTVAGVTYSYQWYKDGTAVNGADGQALSLTDVADSGSYTVKVTASDGTLTSAEGESAAQDVTITKAVPVLSDLSATSVTYGQPLSASTPTGTAKDPETGAKLSGTWSWSAGEGSKHPTVAGDSGKTAYNVTFTPNNTVDYDVNTATVTLTVNKATLTPSVDTVADKVYNGKTDAAGVIKLDGAVLGDQPAAGGTFTFNSADVLGDKTVTVTNIVLTGGWDGNYELDTQTLSNVSTAAKITPKPVTLNWSGDQGLVYNGQPVNVTAAAGALVGSDTCSVAVEGGDAVNAGTYTVKAVSLDNPNYKLPAVVTKGYMIAPKPVVLYWHNMIQTYTGGDLTPKVVAKEEDAGSAPAVTLVGVEDGDAVLGSIAISVTQNGKPAEAKNAGSYTVTGQMDGGGNYTVKGSAALTIQKAPVSFTITNNSMKEGEVHHGATVTPSPANAPFTVIYKNEKGEAADPETEELKAGTYAIWVTLQDDNYRHVGSTDGKAAQLGIFTVYAQTPPPKYAVKFDAEDPEDERDAEGNPIGVLTGGTEALIEAEAGTPRTLPACGYTCSGYAFAGWKLENKIYPAGAAYTQEAREVTFTAQWVKAVHTVEGVVDQDGRPVSDVQVTLMLGSHMIAQRHTDAQGKFSFENIAPGLYNLVASKDGVTMTVEATIVDRDEARNITLPTHKTNSVVVVVPGTPDIVVAHLEENFTDADKALAEKNEDTVVEYKFTVEEVSKDEENEEQQEIQKAAGSAIPALYLDLTLEKTVTEGGTVTTNAMPESNVLLKSVIPLPGELQGKYSYSVVRCHGEGDAAKAEALTTSENADGEYFEVSADKTTLTIWAKKFSTYAVAYTDPPSGGGSSGGGNGTTPSKPSIEQPEHGKIEISPSKPEKGDKVEIIVTPDDGYEVDKVIVTDENGKSVEVTRNPDGTYTYTQPEGQVTISARLRSTGSVSYADCPRDETCPIWPYVDASTAAWYHDGVHYCIDNGLMTGFGNGLFGPDKNLSRAMLAQVLYSRAGKPPVSDESSFEDVDEGAWYAKAVTWAAVQGVVSGYGDGRFGPDDPITREQLAAMLWQDAGSPAATNKELHFADADQTSDWALEALRWAVEHGILSGKGSGILDPTGHATRAEAAAMIQQFCTGTRKRFCGNTPRTLKMDPK